MILNMEVNHTNLQVELIANSSSRSAGGTVERRPCDPVNEGLRPYGKFHGDLGVKLPCNDQHITTKAGDVILPRQSACHLLRAQHLEFHPAGQVVNMTEKELKKVLGKGNITATLSLSA